MEISGDTFDEQMDSINEMFGVYSNRLAYNRSYENGYRDAEKKYSAIIADLKKQIKGVS